MTIKTVLAKSLPLRVGFAYAGTEAKPTDPTMATAYKRAEGVITIATAKHGVTEVHVNERVRYSTDPVGDHATNLRWCRTCLERHLLRVGTDKYATLVCDKRTAERTAAKKAAKEQGLPYQNLRDQFAAQHREQVEARIEAIMTHRERTRDELIDIQLRNNAHLTGTASKRFAVVAAQYRIPLAEAKERALHALAQTEHMTDASAPKTTTEQVA